MEKKYNSSFLKKLDLLLEKNGKTRTDLSIEAGIPYPTIQNWYHKGYENVTMKVIKTLSEYFNVDYNYWMSTQSYDTELSNDLKRYNFSSISDIQKTLTQIRNMDESELEASIDATRLYYCFLVDEKGKRQK